MLRRSTRNFRKAKVVDMESGVPDSSVRRLSAYLRHLELLSEAGVEHVSSRQLAEHIKVGPAQVRRDLALFGQFGMPGRGYAVGELVERLRDILGTREGWKVLVVGVGDLGTALLRYAAFAQRGFDMAAALDVDPAMIGKRIGGVTVESMANLKRIVKESGARLAILAVPADAAQETTDRLGEVGIEGILNFSHVGLEAPPGVHVIYADVTANLEQLSFMVSRGQ